jgi:hypothetical protein
MSSSSKQILSRPEVGRLRSDGGKTWTFTDAEKLTAENVRQVFPNYNPRLKLPGKVEPKFVPR